MSEALKNIIVKKMMVKHALEQFRKLMLLTGKNYEDGVNKLLDQLDILTKIEKELEKKKH
ncbi:MAG: hypothetical protein QM610_11875 [Chitinophagaceae bacterium]